MDEAILNSLLRYSKQLTPSRETYPIPGKGWTGGLRSSEPPVNLSTYYLLDNPSLANTPFKSPSKMTSSASTSALSPPKKRTFGLNSPEKKVKEDKATVQKKVADTETQIRNIIEKEEANRAKFDIQKRQFTNVKKKLEEQKKKKQDDDVRKEFQQYKIQQEELVSNMQEEIMNLRKMLLESKTVIKDMQMKPS